MRAILQGFVLGCAALPAGCATDRPIEMGCTRFEEFRVPVTGTPAADAFVADAGPSPLARVIAQTITPPGGLGEEAPPPPDFLVLSGGGPWGAFGAGFLKGWSEKGTGDIARPARFNLVTGVSTGALQSTYAFLGREQDDALIDAYRIDREERLAKRHGDTFFLNHASMADLGPLETYARERIRPLIDQVAAEGAAGRTLLVGVVDALDGQMWAVDLTRVASELSGAERETCYVGALLASAAVPVVFRQVTISGHPYLDGGVRQSVFVTSVQDAIAEAAAATEAKGRVFILMNGTLGTRPIDALPAKILPTVGRLRTLIFNQIELSSIYNVAAKTPGMTTWLATAEGHRCEQADPDAIFDPTFMRCLTDFGQQRWTTGPTWERYPPDG